MAENPGIERVEDLLRNVHDGSYVIPYFQRGFEWQPRMVCELLVKVEYISISTRISTESIESN